MGTVYRKTVTKPLPPDAEIFTKKGNRVAKWKDRKGKSRTAPLTTGRDGSERIVIESGTYLAKFRDGEGIVQEVSTGCRDITAAKAKLAALERRAELVKGNVMTPSEDKIGRHQDTLLETHVAAYMTHMEAKGSSQSHIDGTKLRLDVLQRDCGFTRLRQITREAMEGWLVQRQAAGMGARTRNSYLQAVGGFCNWCVEEARLLVNPLAKVGRANEEADKRRNRRSMMPAELQRLLFVSALRPLAEYGRETVAKDKAEVKGKRDTWKAAPLMFDKLDDACKRARDRLKDNPAFVAELVRRGQERALIYKTLALTGLRRGELASVTLADLRLDAANPVILLGAANEKARNGAEISLRTDLADDLRGWVATLTDARSAELKAAGVVPMQGQGRGLAPDTPLFNVPKQLVKVLDRDLKLAGIAKADERGRTLDVHALRHTFATLLSVGGVTPRTAQAAMRHSKIDLTMRVYTDPKLLDVQAALDVLPAWPLNGSDEPNTQKATGTDGRKFAPGFALTSHNLVQTESIRDKCGDLAELPQEVNKARKPNDLRAFQERGRRGSNPQPLDRQSSALTN